VTAPPRVNAARKPGAWQKLVIDFRAPRFDEDGNKTANARFVRVTLNGRLLHRNVEVTGPTSVGAGRPTVDCRDGYRVIRFLGFIGWGKPVQVNPSRVANGRNGMAIIAVAGVIANLLTAVAAALLLRLGIFSGVHLPYLDLPRLIATIAYINVLLAVFNFLVPLPPLDGFNFLVNVLPLRWSWQLRQIERFGPIILLLLVLGSQMHILQFNPLQYLVGAPSLWLSHALGVA